MPKDPPKQSKQTRKRRLLAAIPSVAIAIGLAYVAGLGQWSGDRLFSGDGDPPTAEAHRGSEVSYSVTQLDEACASGGAFLPQPEAQTVLSQGPPDDWTDLHEPSDSAFVESGGAEVSIGGRSERTIILTDIHFEVDKLKERPQGAAFYGQCGGGYAGRRLEVDLDSDPPRILDSDASVSRTVTRPIRFPWTVSITDPLLLYITVRTKRCFCEWRARIPWVSGAKRGTLVLDNEGAPFRVISNDDIPAYLGIVSEGHWERMQTDW
jgi:hypothetical protein